MPVVTSAWWNRIKQGYSPQEADECPSGFPIRLYRVCQRESKTAMELFEEGKSQGLTYGDLAERWEVPKRTVENWSAKYGQRGRRAE